MVGEFTLSLVLKHGSNNSKMFQHRMKLLIHHIVPVEHWYCRKYTFQCNTVGPCIVCSIVRFDCFLQNRVLLHKVGWLSLPYLILFFRLDVPLPI